MLNTPPQSTAYNAMLTSEPGMAVCIWLQRLIMNVVNAAECEALMPSKSIFTPCALRDCTKVIKLVISVCCDVELAKKAVCPLNNVAHNVTFTPLACASVTTVAVDQLCVLVAFPLAEFTS